MSDKEQRWIQDLKKGALRNELHIPKDKKIPDTLVAKIVESEPGDTITNPTKVGNAKYKVTNLMHERAVTAQTLKGFRK